MSKRKLPEVSKRIFPYDLVIAWWEDIVADSIWVSIPDIKKSTTAICCTVGWLMKQDDKTRHARYFVIGESLDEVLGVLD